MVKSESLSYRVTEEDIKISRFNGLSIAINRFNHDYNPMHFVYCRLKNLGATKSSAMFWTCLYEKIYKPTDKCLKWISRMTYGKSNTRLRGLENL